MNYFADNAILCMPSKLPFVEYMAKFVMKCSLKEKQLE